MKQYIVFTKVKGVNYVYPNLVSARSWEIAVEIVLETRTKHKVVAVSNEGYVYSENSSVDFQMFDAVKRVIREELKLGEFVKADPE